MSYINTGGSGGSGGTVTDVSGTLNQSSVATGTTTPVISIANPFTFPGTVTNNLSIFAATTSAQLAGVISDETGSGALVFATSPTLVTPVLGTPTSGTLTNCTGYPAANLSGLGTGVATFLATPSSANLAAAVTGETGTGGLVFAVSPALTTPDIGAATGASLTVTGVLTSGSNGGSAGQLSLNGSTSGNYTITVNATGALATASQSLTSSGALTAGTGISAGTSVAATTTVTAGTTITVGTNGGTAGSVTFNGSTSGSISLTANAGANTLTQSSGTFSSPIINTSSGSITSGAQVLAAASSSFQWTGRSKMISPSDGVIEIANAANTDFTRLQFGGTTSSFPAIKRSTTSLQLRLADDSADAALTASTATLSAVAPTVGAGQVGLGATTASTVGAAGGASALPLTPTGYLVINVAGTAFKIPYYAS